MVYMHGGGLKVGSGSLPDLRSQPLVAIGDVILVTLNYRLNVIGFLTTGEILKFAQMGFSSLRGEVEKIIEHVRLIVFRFTC